MKLNVYAIKDIKVGAFKTPFFNQNDAEAIRSVTMVVNDDQSLLNKFPEDFELWKIAEWSDIDGTFDAVPNMMCNALSVLDRPKAIQQNMFKKDGNDGEE